MFFFSIEVNSISEIRRYFKYIMNYMVYFKDKHFKRQIQYTLPSKSRNGHGVLFPKTITTTTKTRAKMLQKIHYI